MVIMGRYLHDNEESPMRITLVSEGLFHYHELREYFLSPTVTVVGDRKCKLSFEYIGLRRVERYQTKHGINKV